ncbi:MAG TPA: ATPase [Acidobacteriaceae bacterium]|nr:ATPase [Acidobacteriaceae bacterium]
MAASPIGHPFLQELANLGCRAVLLTIDEQRNAEWPSDAIGELHSMPRGMTLQQITNTVTYLARSRKFVRIIALDNFNIQIAAALREHLRIPGMGVTTARYFSDRLAARLQAARTGLAVPAFTSIANYDELRQFMQAVPPPWLLTPRNESLGSATRRLEESEQVWRSLDALGDHQSGYLLEQWIEGDRFHVDSIMANGTVLFSALSPCRGASEGTAEVEVLPSIEVSRNAGGIEKLRRANTLLLSRMKMVRGVTHMEFLRSHATGDFYFMETSASVDDRCAANMMKQTHGLDLWVEWAKLEVAAMRGQRYALPSAGRGRKGFPASTDVQHQLA